MIIPSIDIKNGQVVQLKQGKEVMWIDSRSPKELARLFGRFGPVAVVDLDAALGTGCNADLVAECCSVAQCRVGGGIRTKDDVHRWIRYGAQKVIIGTAATPEFLQQFPRGWLVAAIDALNGEVVVEGWRKPTGLRVYEAARRLAPYCSELLFTCVEREGMMCGAAVDTATSLRSSLPVPLTIAGGISNVDEITQLIRAGCNVQLGRALYERRLDLVEAWVNQINFDGQHLVPTVVQDATSGRVLMLAHSNAESIKMALLTGQGWYYSRSRKELWRKGATSGNTQTLLSARWDCDRDVVLFRITQKGPACHTGNRSCFESPTGDVLGQLSITINERRRADVKDSYTRRLLDDPDLVCSKLREEVEEVIEARSADDVAWETADVMYHLLVRAASCGVTFDRICDEFRSRMRQ